jgi:hypothetical protein
MRFILLVFLLPLSLFAQRDSVYVKTDIYEAVYSEIYNNLNEYGIPFSVLQVLLLVQEWISIQHPALLLQTIMIM